MTHPTLGWTIRDWSRAYQEGARPEDLLNPLLESLAADDVAWISRIDHEQLKQQITEAAARRDAVKRGGPDVSLFCVPCAVKDNMDFTGLPTTVACPGFAYQPKTNAFVVQRLIEAGAIVLGKTNLDQFATGLAGVRSPYGAVPNALDPAYVSGGSSSGSASVVARGIVPFALGSDTLGSIRVPAGLNNVIGLKPTRGLCSTSGVFPASRTLDCVSVLATTVSDAREVYEIIKGYDDSDAYSRLAPDRACVPWPTKPQFGIPANPEFYGDAQMAAAFEASLKQLEAFGVEINPIAFDTFDAASALAYADAFVAERFAALEEIYTNKPDAMLPLIRDIISAAKKYSASDAFKAIYKLAELKRQADHIMASLDALLVPSAPTHLRIADVERDPIKQNALLSRYTNFVNLLDFSAIALPAGFREDGLPFGLTLVAPAFAEGPLCDFGARFASFLNLPRGALHLVEQAKAHAGTR